MPYQRAKKVSNILFVRVFGDFTASGAEAEFYQLGKRKYGIKLYRSFELAKKSYERQKIASEHSLAPKVGVMILANKNSSQKLYYGYQTEKATAVEETDIIYKKQKAGLRRKLSKLGMGGDFVDTNCGILKYKLVAVDFGSHCKK